MELPRELNVLIDEFAAGWRLPLLDRVEQELKMRIDFTNRCYGMNYSVITSYGNSYDAFEMFNSFLATGNVIGFAHPRKWETKVWRVGGWEQEFAGDENYFYRKQANIWRLYRARWRKQSRGLLEWQH